MASRGFERSRRQLRVARSVEPHRRSPGRPGAPQRLLVAAPSRPRRAIRPRGSRRARPLACRGRRTARRDGGADHRHASRSRRRARRPCTRRWCGCPRASSLVLGQHGKQLVCLDPDGVVRRTSRRAVVRALQASHEPPTSTPGSRRCWPGPRCRSKRASAPRPECSTSSSRRTMVLHAWLLRLPPGARFTRPGPRRRTVPAGRSPACRPRGAVRLVPAVVVGHRAGGLAGTPGARLAVGLGAHSSRVDPAAHALDVVPGQARRGPRHVAAAPPARRCARAATGDDKSRRRRSIARSHDRGRQPGAACPRRRLSERACAPRARVRGTGARSRCRRVAARRLARGLAGDRRRARRCVSRAPGTGGPISAWHSPASPSNASSAIARGWRRKLRIAGTTAKTRRLSSYLDRSAELDRRSLALLVIVPRGWLIVGLCALAPAFVNGADAIALGTGIGGVVLAWLSLARLSSGVDQLASAHVAWQRVAPLFHAAAGVLPARAGSARPSRALRRATAPEYLVAPPTRRTDPALEAVDVSFRHARPRHRCLVGLRSRHPSRRSCAAPGTVRQRQIDPRLAPDGDADAEQRPPPGAQPGHELPGRNRMALASIRVAAVS